MTTCEQLAVKLFGWTFHDDEMGQYWKQPGYHKHWHKLPQWDSSWSGAGEVIEAMESKGYLWQMWRIPGEFPRAGFHNRKDYAKVFLGEEWQEGASGPEAIAKAALEALDTKDEE